MPDATRWIIYAVLGAFFAAVVQVTSKPPVDQLGSTAVNLTRAVVMTLFFVGVLAYEFLRPAWAIPPIGAEGSGAKLSKPALYAIAAASGIAASLSWFCGYRALQLSAVSKSYPIDKLSVAFGVILAVIFLGERPSATNYAGIGLMIVGAYLVTLKSS